jgi:polysaccharide export outer membrane protein
MITKKYFNKRSKVLVKFALHFITFSILIFSTQALSYQVSQAQIEQFKKLPPSQQKALAKSMGIDISDFKGQFSGNNSRSELTGNTQRYTRGTQFDQQGNPSLNANEEENFQQVKKLKPFGYDVFANSPQTFAPTMDIAIPAGYIVASGDRVSIQVFGKESNELELEVNRKGQIIFPSQGTFAVAGLSYGDMKRLLIAKIKEKSLVLMWLLVWHLYQ